MVFIVANNVDHPNADQLEHRLLVPKFQMATWMNNIHIYHKKQTVQMVTV